MDSASMHTYSRTPEVDVEQPVDLDDGNSGGYCVIV